MNLWKSPYIHTPAAHVLFGSALAAGFGWSIASVSWTALPFAAAWLIFAVRRILRLNHAREYAALLAQSVDRLGASSFRRPVSDRVPKELDRLAGSLAAKSLRLAAIERENRQYMLSLEGVFAAADGPLVLVDDKGLVRKINQAVTDTFQVSDANACGFPFFQVVREHEIDDALALAIKDGNPRRLELDVLTSKNPGRYTVRIHPLINGDDSPESAGARRPNASEDQRGVGAVVSMTDVTRLRHLERVRKEFVANVSHELRTPITSIKGFVETLVNEDLPPETRDRFFTILKQEADRLDALLGDLLDLSMLESDTRPLKRSAVNLPRLAAEVVALLEPQARRKQIACVVSIPEDLPEVPAHAGMLEQALVNLVDNAIKYSPEGSSITIEGKRVGHDHVEVAVVDDGPGIPSEHLPRLFERFYRVDKARSRSAGGSGLGLAIVRHIVQRHGGAVRAESRLGKGSRFVVTLPTEAEEAPVSPWDEK